MPPRLSGVAGETGWPMVKLSYFRTACSQRLFCKDGGDKEQAKQHQIDQFQQRLLLVLRIPRVAPATVTFRKLLLERAGAQLKSGPTPSLNFPPPLSPFPSAALKFQPGGTLVAAFSKTSMPRCGQAAYFS